MLKICLIFIKPILFLFSCSTWSLTQLTSRTFGTQFVKDPATNLPSQPNWFPYILLVYTPNHCVSVNTGIFDGSIRFNDRSHLVLSMFERMRISAFSSSVKLAFFSLNMQKCTQKQSYLFTIAFAIDFAFRIPDPDDRTRRDSSMIFMRRSCVIKDTSWIFIVSQPNYFANSAGHRPALRSLTAAMRSEHPLLFRWLSYHLTFTPFLQPDNIFCLCLCLQSWHLAFLLTKLLSGQDLVQLQQQYRWFLIIHVPSNISW